MLHSTSTVCLTRLGRTPEASLWGGGSTPGSRTAWGIFAGMSQQRAQHTTSGSCLRYVIGSLLQSTLTQGRKASVVAVMAAGA